MKSPPTLRSNLLDVRFGYHCVHRPTHEVSLPVMDSGRKNTGMTVFELHIICPHVLQDENGKGLSPVDIRAEVDTFLFEGKYW